MPAYLHSLSRSQADKEISFVHPHTCAVGVIRRPLLPRHSPVLLGDAAHELCTWLHHSSLWLFPCSPVIEELLVFSSSWETQIWHGTTSPSSLKAVNTRGPPEFVLELQAFSSPLLSPRANFLFSPCLLSLWKQIKVTETNIPNLQLHVVTFVLL